MITEPIHAARMFAAYGNVSCDPVTLLAVRPTERDLQAAVESCICNAYAAARLLREHFHMEQPDQVDLTSAPQR